MATALLHEEFIDDETAALREAFNADFWEQAGWDASLRLVRPPADHPLLGYSCCVIPGCEQRAIKHGGICPVCRRRQEKTSLTVEQFIADAQLEPAVAGSRRRLFDATCLVEDCPRPQQVQSVRLCNTRHSLCGDRFGATTADTVDQFLRQTDVVPLTPLGPCRVLACTRLASTVRGLCQSHHGRWKAAHARKDFDFEHWLKTDSGLKRIGVVNLRAIPELVMWEFMIAVQRRSENWGAKVACDDWDALVRHARSTEVASIHALDPGGIRQGEVIRLLQQLQREARLALQNWEAELCKDIWDLGLIGLPGVLNFTDITQPWLRAATRWWICEELPRRRTSRTYKVLRGHIQSMGLLSASLRRARADHGSDPSALGRSDILVFLTRQAYERDQDIITDTTLLRTGGRSN